MSKNQRAKLAKKRFIAQQVLIFGGLSSLLGTSSLYYHHFGWHLGFNFDFAVRGLGVFVFWGMCWYLMSLWMRSQTPHILKRISARKRQTKHKPA